MLKKSVNVKFYILSTLCFLLIQTVVAQKDTLTFKLTKPIYQAEIVINDSVFRSYEKNYFSIKKTEELQITRVEVLNGKVTLLANGSYYVTFSKPGPSYVKVYAKNVKGDPVVAALRSVKVIDFDLPILYVSGVKADSAIDLNHLIKTGTVTAYSTQLKKAIRVKSFGVVVGTDTTYVLGDGFPIELKNKFQLMQDGDQLVLYNVRVEFPNELRTVKIIPRFSVFITETDQYSTGTRKYIENKSSNPFEP